MTAALTPVWSVPLPGAPLIGFGPIETLLPAPTERTVIPLIVVQPLAHSELPTLMRLPVPSNAASAPVTLRVELFATRISGPFRVRSVLALLRENRSPLTWRLLFAMRLRMAPFVDVSVLLVRAMTGLLLVMVTLFENRIASLANVRLLPAVALKIGAVALNSMVSNTAPASLVIVAPEVASSVRPVLIGSSIVLPCSSWSSWSSVPPVTRPWRKKIDEPLRVPIEWVPPVIVANASPEPLDVTWPPAKMATRPSTRLSGLLVALKSGPLRFIVDNVVPPGPPRPPMERTRPNTVGVRSPAVADEFTSWINEI